MDNPQPITARGSRFVDPQGRQVILHGINLVNKDPTVRYLGDEGPENKGCTSCSTCTRTCTACVSATARPSGPR